MTGSISFSRMATLVVLTMVMIIVPSVLGLSSENFHLGRHLMQSENASEADRKSDDTVRVDPLNHLKKYRGGYDITNKHYWSSTAFTGIYGYAIAVFWMLCGLVYGVYLLVTSFHYKKNREKVKKRSPCCYKQFHFWHILVAVSFTILATIGCCLVLGGTAKFHSRAKTVVDILIDTADAASDTIYNTTAAMMDMSNTLAAANETGQATSFLTSTSRSLDKEAADIHRQAKKNRRAIYKGLKIVYVITAVVISLNLVAAIAMTVFGILKLPRTIQLLIGICWIFTVLCWVFFGVYFFIDNFADDTCTALEGFQQDPYNNSLSSILPCDELIPARSVLTNVRAGVHNMVKQINRNISRTYGNVVQICNPFSASPEYRYLQPQECQANTIQIGDIPQLLKQVACPDYEGSTCSGGIKIPIRDYNLVEEYTKSVQNLLDQYPDMESLVECQTVTNAFSEILNNHCKPLKRDAKMVWAAMVFLSVVMVALVLLWTNEVHYQKYAYSSDSSVKPYFAASETLESGVDKEPIGEATTRSIQ